ncbi:head-tail adaptor protein [Chelatococcus sambhunathii]|uniref:Head-tail adaptor protein n=1 Tax=Chelatococcus sambhunathii TaxID=363953 RepID=A0ABU1DET8_9HYPH|nr:head-tail adaptor protein [Chelatococcus sambhunathii]MDR4306565.1 head-tail adaptor protein [Chelatococcus sambhunathii]
MTARRCLISIEAATETANEFGGVAETWATVKTVRAWIMDQGVIDSDEGPGVAAPQSVTLRIRSVAGLSTANRITLAGRAHDIVELRPLGRAGVEIRCVAS